MMKGDFKIVIIDDDLEIYKKINKLIKKIEGEIKIKITVKYYDEINYESLEEIKDMSMDKIYLLDINIRENENGLRYAKKIRDTDKLSNIIFLTNYYSYFQEAHKYILSIYDFIEKDSDYLERIEKHTNDIINAKLSNDLFYYEEKDIVFQLRKNDIYYIYKEKNKRYLVMVTKNSYFYIKISLNTILEMLDKRFKMVHRSCIANNDVIRIFNYKEGYFELENGERVNMLSRNYRGNHAS